MAGVVLVAALFTMAIVRADDVAPRPPDGWWIYKTGELNETDNRCTDNAITSRFAALSNGALVLSSGGECRPAFTDTPFAGGRLEGEDMGEFGGALCWAAPDGFTRLQVLGENARGFLRTPYGNFVLTGGDFGLSSVGHIWRLSDESVMPPVVSPAADIHEAPLAFDLSADGSIVIVTHAKIVRLKAPGSVQTLTKVDFGSLSSNSVVAMPDGAIHVGMRHCLTRLIPVNEPINWYGCFL